MAQWYCFKCNEQMEDSGVLVSYLDFHRIIDLLRCPQCGIAFATAELAEQAREIEEMLEDKPAE